MSAKNRPARLTRKERRAQSPAAGALTIPEAFRNAPVRTNEELGLRAMSEVLEELVRPVAGALQSGDNPALVEHIYQLGAAVWNATSDAAPATQLAGIAALFAKDRDPTTTERVVDLLAARRRALFADDRRIIVDLKLNWSRGELNVAVATIVR